MGQPVDRVLCDSRLQSDYLNVLVIVSIIYCLTNFLKGTSMVLELALFA